MTHYELEALAAVVRDQGARGERVVAALPLALIEELQTRGALLAEARAIIAAFEAESTSCPFCHVDWPLDGHRNGCRLAGWKRAWPTRRPDAAG